MADDDICLSQLYGGTPEQAADVFRVIAGEIESGCMLVEQVRLVREQFGPSRIEIMLIAFGTHEDDLVPGSRGVRP